MQILAKGYGNRSHFYDIDARENWSNYCPCCEESFREPSNHWCKHLYRHTCTEKHMRNEAFYNLMASYDRPQEVVIGEAQAHHSCNRRL